MYMMAGIIIHVLYLIHVELHMYMYMYMYMHIHVFQQKCPVVCMVRKYTCTSSYMYMYMYIHMTYRLHPTLL